LSTPTVLLDLDNTLIGNDMQTFLPPYFAALEKRLSNVVDPDDLRSLMVASVKATQANHDPTLTNMAVFTADFAWRTGLSVAELQALLEVFYRDDYPQLRQYTTTRTEAQRVVRRLLADGCQVVIATNPLFPAVAIEQRLDWAGIGGLPYALVTTMENSHFSKPDPRYYEAILRQIGATPETTWMVGDHPINDMAPARQVGLKTWWITDDAQKLTGSQPAPVCDRQGTLAEFLAWVESGGLSVNNA
jgi:HAD superfamily hydrolase (TIGR01549 family)